MHVVRKYLFFVFILFSISIISFQGYGQARVAETHLKNTILLMAFLIIGIMILSGIVLVLFIQRNKMARFNKELIFKLGKIQIQKEELLFKSDELAKFNSQLIDSNKSLESMISERTKKLYAQNDKLKAYAFANAHQLRAPVARILGLLNLIKHVHKEDIDENLISVLQECALELDEIIKKIGKELEMDYLPIDEKIKPSDILFPDIKSKL